MYFRWALISGFVLSILAAGWFGCYVYAQSKKDPLLTPLADAIPTPSPTVDVEVEMLEEVVVVAVTATPSASPTPKKIVPTPTLKPSPTAATSQEINSYIEKYGSQYSVDKDVLRHMALCESGFNSSAVNNIYVGLFQFGESSWKSNRKEMGEDASTDLRFSAEESVKTASYAISKGREGMWPNCVPK